MMLAGFEFPTGGEIRLDGELLNNVPPHKRNIGMVFQNYALFPHLTVEQNVAYPLTVRKLPAAERAERVAHALKMVQMERFALSGAVVGRPAAAHRAGARARVRAEAGADGRAARRARQAVARTHAVRTEGAPRKLGVTFVYVTHGARR